MSYMKHVAPNRHASTRTITRRTPAFTQNTRLPGAVGAAQVRNSSGCYVFNVDKWTQLTRFLINGSLGGSFYIGEKQLTKQNLDVVNECIAEDGLRVVRETVAISDAGRALKNEHAVLVLALCARYNTKAQCPKRPEEPGISATRPALTRHQLAVDRYEEAYKAYKYAESVRHAALEALPKVARIGTDLFSFAETVEALGGWGAGLRKAVAKWYTKKDLRNLAYQLIKYRSRNTEKGNAASRWSHADLIKLSHPKAPDDAYNEVFRWVLNPEIETHNEYIEAFRELTSLHKVTARNTKRVVELIHEHRFTHEMLLTEYKNNNDVWEALLENMPAHAVIRNLGQMTSNNLLVPLSNATAKVVNVLTNVEQLKKARVHPVALLIAAKIYGQGHGDKGVLRWSPNEQITRALDRAFYESFKAVEPTGKKYLLGVDVSGSMSQYNCAGATVLKCAEGTAAMALATVNIEPNSHVVGFAQTVRDLGISCNDSLQTTFKKVRDNNFGSTNCAAAIEYAIQRNLDVDVFCIYTDNETNNSHAPQAIEALRKYREKTGKPAKMITLGMISNSFTLGAMDAGCFDISGFDASAPKLIAEFSKVPLQ